VWSGERTDTARTQRRAEGLKKGYEPLPSRSAEEGTVAMLTATAPTGLRPELCRDFLKVRRE